MSQRPAPPQPLSADKGGQDAGFDRWLFLFYSWLKSVLSNVVSAAAGNVFYSDGAGNITSEAAFTYASGTNTLTVDYVTSINHTLTGYLDLTELADPGYATANHAWLHAEDVAGITQIHHNTSGHKWAIGQDNWIVARNVTGAPIPALRAVYVTGSTGTRPQITMADADLHNHALGITQDTIADNGYGAVVISGYVKGIDTATPGWVAGDALYVSSTAGVLTTTAPTFPASRQRVATVIYSHASQGIIQVFHHGDDREGDGVWETPFKVGDGTTAGEIRLLEPSGTQYTAFKAQAQAANITYILPAADATVSGYALKSDAAGNLSWGAAGGEELKRNIAQTTHGFSVGNPVYYNGTIYVKADCTTEAAAEVVGIVSVVIDSNNFTLVYGGYITGLSGLTAGSVHFLSSTAGALTTTEPTTSGYISKPLLIANSTTTGYFFNMRGQEIGGGVAGVREITSGTATAGQTVLTVTYTPGYVDVYVNGVRLLAADYTATNGTSITLGTGMAVNDEWVVVVWSVVALAQIVAPTVPGGRLTLATATPVMATDQTAKQTVYYTPYVGDLIPIYDGTAWNMKRFAELSMAMAGSANWAINSNYDLYVYNDGGTLRLGTGAAWTSATARNESLTLLNGIYVNTATMTLRYGASSTVSVAASRATYVGTMRTTGNTGETTWAHNPAAAAGGGACKLFLWNAYNRRQCVARSIDSTVSWTYATAAWRAMNNNANNSVAWVRGLDEDAIHVMALSAPDTLAAGDTMRTGVGLDSATPSGAGTIGNMVSSAGGMENTSAAMWNGLPGIGYHYAQHAENSATAATVTMYGNGYQQISATGMF